MNTATNITLVDELAERVTRLETIVDMLLRDKAPQQQPKEPTPEHFSALDFTGKQHAVIQMIYYGYSTAKMAETLAVSTGTVKVHINSIMNRIGVRSRSQIPALYEEWLDRLSADQYKRQSGISMGWGKDPEAHMTETSQLRIKTR